MISWKNVFIVFKKEFLQLMRDKSVLFTNFFLPLFGLPLYLLFVIEMIQLSNHYKQKPLNDDTVFTVSIQGELPEGLKDKIAQDKKVKVVPIQSGLLEKDIVAYRESRKSYKDVLGKSMNFSEQFIAKKDDIKREKELLEQTHNKFRHQYLEIQKKYDEKKAELHLAFFENGDGQLISYSFFKESNKLSSAAKDYLNKQMVNYFDEVIVQNKKRKGVVEADLTPSIYNDVDLDYKNSRPMKIAGMMMGGFILFYFVISVLNPALNNTIGERDQKTYKTLLMNPISFFEIFIGKYINVALQGMLAIIPYGLEIIVAYTWGSSLYIFPNLTIFTPLKVVLLVISIFAVGLMISALCFFISSFSKTKEQAQALLTFIVLSILIPNIAIGITDVELNIVTTCLPLINFPLVTEHLMGGELNSSLVFLSIAINLICSIFLLWLSMGAFEVQWRGSQGTHGLADLLVFKRRLTSKLLPVHSFLAFTLAIIGYIYGGFLIKHQQTMILSMYLAPIVCCIGVAWLILGYSGLDFTKVIKWDGLKLKESTLVIIFSALASIGLNYVVSFFEFSKVLGMEMPTLFEDNTLLNLLSSLIVISIIPGICEEFLFRGIIFQGFRNKYNFILSSLISSLFFATAHFSFFKSFHTFFMGLVLAYLYEKRGILICIIAHMVFNGTSILIAISPLAQKFLHR